MAPGPYHQDQHHTGDLYPGSRSKPRCRKIEHGTKAQDGEPERREIVMEEELPLHEEEGEVMQCPSDDEE